MDVLEFKQLVAAIPDKYNKCPVIVPMHTGIPGVFCFEGVCPAVTEIITVGEALPLYELNDGRKIDAAKEMKAFLIAPHSFHEGEDGEPDAKHVHKLN